MGKLFEINLTCDECGVELWRIDAGYVCPNGHGRIKPFDDAQAECELPLNPDGGGRVRQRSARVVGNEVAKALRAIKRYEDRERKKREQQEREEAQQRKAKP